MILGHLAACTIEQYGDGSHTVKTHEVIAVYDLAEIPTIESFMIEHILPPPDTIEISQKSLIVFMPTEKNFSKFGKEVDDLEGIG